MAVFIDSKKKSKNALLKLLPQNDNCNERIVSAWVSSKIAHCFDDKKIFIKAVGENSQTSKSPVRITLFTASNYLFSTKACDRLEPLYFKDAAGQTGRLRQQHKKGPLAKIDESPKRHL